MLLVYIAVSSSSNVIDILAIDLRRRVFVKDCSGEMRQSGKVITPLLFSVCSFTAARHRSADSLELWVDFVFVGELDVSQTASNVSALFLFCGGCRESSPLLS